MRTYVRVEMAYPMYLRQRARHLRVTKQLSLNELAERLALPKTTVYCWIADLPLGRPRRENPHPGTRAMQQKYKRLREQAYVQGLVEYDTLVHEPTFRDFVVLYIAEGYKRSRNSASICNSDPAIVVMAAAWMKRLSSRVPAIRVQHHLDQNPGELRAFWAEQLGIDPHAVVLLPKSNSSQLRTRTWRCAHGVAAVDVHDTLFRARLQAWMDRVKGGWI
jgi:hypothetical protein